MSELQARDSDIQMIKFNFIINDGRVCKYEESDLKCMFEAPPFSLPVSTSPLPPIPPRSPLRMSSFRPPPTFLILH